MTKKEKLAINKQLGLIWMEIRAYKNSNRGDWNGIQSKYQDYMDANQELCDAIEVAHPKLIKQIKELRYPNDIEKAIKCLNAMVPSDK